jgi:asparagine synthase (glutamine-hydrolysing)
LGVESAKINIAHDQKKVFELLSKAQWHNDEPITSLSAVSYMMMMERAKDLDAKVLLTGQGADEIFCGYKKYLGFYMKNLVRGGHGMKALGVGLGFLKTRSLVNEIHLGELKRYVKFLNKPHLNVLSSRLKALPQPSIGLGSGDVSGRQILDLTKFSVPALLHYEDRLSMAHAREVRVPYLDYRIVNFGISLPMEFKIHQGWSKYILRKSSEGLVPQNITWRKDKRGFTIPQESWFKNELHSEVENILHGQSMIYDYGFVDKRTMIEKYEIFCGNSTAAKMISFKEIFTPIALENWLQTFKEYLKPDNNIAR